MNREPSIAVVVPVLRDAAVLERLLSQIAAWSEAPDEILVVAAAGDDDIVELCTKHRCRLIHSAANRGLQFDTGARAATSALLWFVHADAALPADGLGAIRAAIEGGAESGCFRFAFQESRSLSAGPLARLINLRVRCGGVPYGDQGLFALKQAYLEAGGFARQPLFEEVRLVKRLRARGSFEMLRRSIRVATRRWDRDGWWARSLRNRWLALCFMLGVPAERLARSYYRNRPQ